jgi:hypothetical protein
MTFYNREHPNRRRLSFWPLSSILCRLLLPKLMKVVHKYVYPDRLSGRSVDTYRTFELDKKRLGYAYRRRILRPASLVFFSVQSVLLFSKRRTGRGIGTSKTRLQHGKTLLFICLFDRHARPQPASPCRCPTWAL